MPSAFSDVDAASAGERLVDMLEQSARGLAAMKHYMAVAHALREPAAPILDLGCGAGHDLAILERFGVPAVGIDPSATMLAAALAAQRSRSPVVRGAGERLPFRDGSLGGCRIERVLMHVVDPAAVIAEAVRCVAPGGLLTVFEPDWSSLCVNGTHVPTEWVSIARHASIGATAGDLLRHAGCVVRDRVEEHSWWDFEAFKRVTNIEDALNRAVSSGLAFRSTVESWLAEQERRAAAGEFSAEIKKILWVATAPG